jgi:hypothetical protein
LESIDCNPGIRVSETASNFWSGCKLRRGLGGSGVEERCGGRLPEARRTAPSLESYDLS